MRPVSQKRQSRVGPHVGPPPALPTPAPKLAAGPCGAGKLKNNNLTPARSPLLRSGSTHCPSAPPWHPLKPAPHQPLTSISPPHQAAAGTVASWQSHTPGRTQDRLQGVPQAPPLLAGSQVGRSQFRRSLVHFHGAEAHKAAPLRLLHVLELLHALRVELLPRGGGSGWSWPGWQQGSGRGQNGSWRSVCVGSRRVLG